MEIIKSEWKPMKQKTKKKHIFEINNEKYSDKLERSDKTNITIVKNRGV